MVNNVIHSPQLATYLFSHNYLMTDRFCDTVYKHGSTTHLVHCFHDTIYQFVEMELCNLFSKGKTRLTKLILFVII